MKTRKIFIPNQSARKSLSKKLNLHFDESMQDWEWEIADQTRISEFIQEYKKTETSDNEKMSLMEIIIDSSNDLIYDKEMVDFNKSFKWIKETLIDNYELHSGTFDYWKNGSFDISPEFKKIKTDHNKELW